MNSGDNKSIRSILMEEIEKVADNSENRLPSEAVLAKRLGISRTQIRDYMAELENDGYISRRRGIGTQINKHVLCVPLRMDFEIEFADRIIAMGYEPETIVKEVTTVTADEKLARELEVGIGTPALRIGKIVRASGTIAIYCIDYISFGSIRDYSYDLKPDDFEAPVFDFLAKHCGSDVYLDLTTVNAVVADAELAAIMEVKEGSPLLNFNERGYDIDGKPILWSQEFFVPGIIEYTVLRKRH